MKTKEGNRMIAEFMGLTPHQIDSKTWGLSVPPWVSVTESTPEKVMDTIAENLRYDSDWNFLMEVVDKIESLGYTFELNMKNIVIVFDDETNQDILYIDEGDKKKSFYVAVVEFIKWHKERF